MNEMNETNEITETGYDLKPARKTFSRIGIALCVILLAALIAQVLFLAIATVIEGEQNWFLTSSWGFWVLSFVPLYAVAIPCGLLLMRKLPRQKPEDRKMGAAEFVMLIPICMCLMYGGSIIGNILSSVLSGGTAENQLLKYAMDSNPLKIVVMVILAPLLEEYVCRKQIIDRTRQYGEKVAVVLSAVAFGLLHQNLFQFFYAFAVGLVFGYVYIRTGRMRYTVALHSILNFMGSVLAPWVLTLVDPDLMASLDPNMPPEELMAIYSQILPGLMIYLLYAFALFGLSIAGIVLIIVNRKKVIWKEAENPLPKGTAFKTAYLNVGMILYIVVCLASFVIALL